MSRFASQTEKLCGNHHDGLAPNTRLLSCSNYPMQIYEDRILSNCRKKSRMTGDIRGVRQKSTAFFCDFGIFEDAHINVQFFNLHITSPIDRLHNACWHKVTLVSKIANSNGSTAYDLPGNHSKQHPGPHLTKYSEVQVSTKAIKKK